MTTPANINPQDYLDRLEAILFRPGWRRRPSGLGWPVH